MGLSKRVEALIKALSSRSDVKIYVYSPIIFGPFLDLIKNLGEINNLYIKYIKLPIPRRILIRIFKGFFAKGIVALLYSFIVFFHLIVDRKRILSSKNKGSIIQHEQLILAPLAYLIRRIYRGRMIADDVNLLFIRTHGFKRRLIHMLEYISLMKTDVIVTASSKTMTYTSKIGKKTRYIQNALINIKDHCYCLEKTRKLSKKRDRINIVFVGNLTFHQNIKAVIILYTIFEYLVEKLGIRNVRLDIVGGPLHNIPQHILNSNLVKKGYMVFHGMLSEEEKDRLYSEALISLLPYFGDLIRWGGQMTKTLEALSNCMILITGPEGVGEINGVNGVHYLIAKNIRDMINLLIRVVNNPSKYNRVAVNGYRLICSDYSVNAIKEKYSMLIDELLANRCDNIE